MNDERIATRPAQIPWTNVVQFHGDAFLGNIFHRASTQPFALAGKIENRDRIFSTASIIKDSFGEASVTTVGAVARHARLRLDAKTGEFEGDAPNPFDGFRDTL